MARSAAEQLGVDLPEVEAAVVEAEAAEPDRPEWLPDNFKSPEDLATSYRELQAEHTRSRQQYRQLETRIEELAQAQEQRPQQQYQQAGQDNPLRPWAEAYANALGVDEEAAFQALQLQNTLVQMQIQAAAQQWQGQQQTDPRIVANLAEQQVIAEMGDSWGALRDDVMAEVQDNPYLVPNSGDPAEIARALTKVAKMVAAEKGVTAQADHDRVSRQQKLLAQTVPGQGGRTVSSVDPVEALKASWSKIGVVGYGR